MMYILLGLLSGFISILCVTFIRMRRMRQHVIIDYDEDMKLIQHELSAQRVVTSQLHFGIQELIRYKYKILVIDDEPATRLLFDLRFRKHHETVRLFFANGVVEARAMFKALRFDLCIVDLRLGDGHGIDLIQSFIAIDPDMKFIVVTAYASNETARMLLAMNIPIIEKPVNDFSDIYTAVKRALYGTALIQKDTEVTE